MYEHDRTTKTCAWIKAIAISNPENAIIKANGNKPNIKNNIPLVIILYVNPLNILNNIWPDRTFAANLSPNETLRDRYDINSINTNKGNKAKGQPAGTNNEKNSVPCLLNPKIVAPKSIVKLKENVNIKWLVDAKL